MIATVTFNPSLDKSVTVDGLVVDETNRWTSYRQYPGGKGINVSKIILRLGGRSKALGFLGGRAGDFIKKYLAANGVFLARLYGARHTYKVIKSRYYQKILRDKLLFLTARDSKGEVSKKASPNG